MKFNQWTLGLAAVGVVSLASVVQAEDKPKLYSVENAVSGTIISGYVDVSGVYRPGKNTSTSPEYANPWNTPGLGGGNKADGFNLNAVKLGLQRDFDDADWAAGYKADLMFGPDAVGWSTSANSMNSDLAIRQAYVALRAPIGTGLNIKLGVFDTECVGFESNDNGDNPHYSHSYGWGLEPATHTGLMMQYNAASWLTIKGGIANTAGANINARATRTDLNGGANPVAETEKTYMASLVLTAPEDLGFLKDSKLYLGVIDGLNGGFSDTTWMYAGLALKTPVQAVTVGGAFDYKYDKASGDAAKANYRPSNYAYAIGGYISVQPVEKLKLNFRGEYAKSKGELWYNSILDGNGDSRLGGAALNAPASWNINQKGDNQLLGLTATVDYSLWENVISRIEVRFDRDLTDQHSSAGFAGGPFGVDDNDNLYVAFNLIYKF